MSKSKKIYLDDGSFGDIFDNEISDEKLSEITPLLGEIILEFNQIEDGLDDIIMMLIAEHRNDTSFTIIAKMKFSQKIELFKDIVLPACRHSHKPDFLLEFESLIAGLKEAAENRNRAVHARWIDADKEFYVRTKIKVDKKGVYGVFFKLDEKTLKKYIKNMQELSEILYDDLYEKFIDSLL